MRHTINLSKKKPPFIIITMVVYVLVIVSLMVKINAQVNNNTIINKDFGNSILKSSIGNLTSRLAVQMEDRAPFCIADGQTDWDRAFNYTNNWEFVEACALRTQGDVGARLCSQGEITFYLNSFFNKVGDVKYSKPNRNCNASSWVGGCEPGWACSIDSDNQTILLDPEKGLRDDQIPARTRACRTCCDGFFCPEGLTCMLPCPLGAYCPQATLNETTSLCDPYQYPLPPGRNHTCGGANIWADYGSSKQIFCPAGSYCPTTTDKKACDSGNYCLTGSTLQKKCTTLISCKGNTEKQNIQTYGIMLIVALVAVLLIVYNFSDQLLALRERRRAKFRERAVRSVEQNERVRARWRAAKDAAKKHVSGIQGNFSTRFSQRKIKIGHEGDVKGDDYLLSAQQARNTSDSQPSSIAFEGEIEGSVTEGHLPVDESHKEINLSLEVEGKSPKTIPKGKRVRTESQIFKYAYEQIEKEKHRERQTEDRSLSGVISMATGDQIVKRPLIEIDFKDLTLTLKGKKRHILKNLTGKISPGHIAAVMGPSGAGKTTLLTALAGKATGCSTSGLVLINGRPESIHSYKKIVGFVPQDDIVHGNLTVEENLWFSARCRLPSNLPRADRVLIVERAIMNLGLHDVRDSLVGTVEERGISGGQKKRVNVGLEMVMEPSLLFLDEPTSGLDSSSSRLLLRALRQEALAGVNICMVVHQPSYALFRMFDDLILLAKGGLMVYNGPVTQVEDYFSGMGIVVPDRVNPPDYFIDILEGLIPSRVNYKELPLRWMLHNGYPVPEDLRSQFAGVEMSQRSESSLSAGENETFAGELWHDVRDNVELHRDQIHLNFLRRMDLSNRRTPGVISQYKYFIGRITKQRLREAKLLATDYLILLLAGACLGAISKISDENFGASGFTYTIIAISLLCQIAALRTFSLDKLQYLRESASGISSLAHFLAKDTIDHFNTVVKPVVYLSMFYFFTNPRSTFVDNYIVMMCLVYCVTGMGYAFATFLNPGPAQLFSVLIPVCLTLISSQSLSNSGLKFIASLCYPKWTLEALVIANAKKYYGVWLINRCGALAKLDYSLHSWKLCIMILLIYGAVSRVIAFIGLLVMRKK